MANGTKKYGRNKAKCKLYRMRHGGGTRRKVSHSSKKNTPFLKNKRRETFTMPQRFKPLSREQIAKRWPDTVLASFMKWTGITFARPPHAQFEADPLQAQLVQVGTMKKARVEKIPRKRIPS